MKRFFTLSFLIFIGNIALYSQCENVSTGGLIAADQTFCTDSADPQLITEIEAPSGGLGTLEYLWISTTQSPTSSTVVWYPIANSNSAELDPDPISQTTYYRRCVRRSGCTEYIGESNIITVIVGEDCDDPCDFFKINLENSTPATCSSDNGTVNISIVAGAVPISYQLNGQVIDEIPENLMAGEYTLIATDANNCSDVLLFTIEADNNNLAIEATITDTNCTNTSGIIDLTVSGSSSSLNYNWLDGSTDEDRSNLAEGEYTVTVTDAQGCSATETFTVGLADSDLSAEFNITNVTCNGESNGAIDAEIFGGTPPFLLLLNGTPASSFNDLSAGDYDVFITDLNGCSITETVTINEPASLTLDGIIQNPTCGTDNGSIQLVISGGTTSNPSDYQISWSTGNGENLSAGTYSVTVSDLNNCSTEATFTLTGSGSDLAVSLESTTPISCNGADDGTATLGISGGLEPYSYVINGISNSEFPSNFSAGNYQVLISDANNCSVEIVFDITDVIPVSTTALINNSNCETATGSIDLTPAGGNPPYQFIWSNGATTEDLDELIAGNYTVTVTDSNGCQPTEFHLFTVNDSGNNIELEISTSPATCKGADDGTIIIGLVGAIEPLSYELNGESISTLPNQYPAGEYILTVIDATGCSAETNFIITEPDPLVFNFTRSNTSCGETNGSIEATGTGGTPPYTYAWSNGETSQNLIGLAAGTYSLTLTDSNGCTSETEEPIVIEDSSGVQIFGTVGATSCGEANGSISIDVSGGISSYIIEWSNGINEAVTISDLAAGNYTVTVTDMIGCSHTESFNIEASSPLITELTVTDASCNGADDGMLDIGFSNGTPPFSYILNGINFDAIPVQLAADDYQLQIIDAQGCIFLSEFTISEPNEIIYLAEFNEAHCPDDNASIIFEAIAGGSGTYTYVWSDGSTNLDRDDLETGTYYLTITDTEGCEAISEPFEVLIPEEISITAAGAIQNITCPDANDGFVDITVTGGTAPYTYFWSTGATTEDIANLPPGDYTVQVVDANGCVELFLAILTEPDPLSANVETTLAGCDLADGTAAIVPFGGTPPYFYNWDSGNTDSLQTNLEAGIYKVTLSDFASCQAFLEVTIEEEDCFGSGTGEEFRFVVADATANPDSRNISLMWQTEAEATESFFILQHSYDGETYEDLTGLMPGIGQSASLNEYNHTCHSMALGTHYFRVRYVDAYGNLETSEIIQAAIIPENANIFSVYPNPVNEELTLNFLNPLEHVAKVELINAQAIVLQKLSLPAGTLRYQFDLSDLPSSIYFLKVKKEGLRQQTKRIVKH